MNLGHVLNVFKERIQEVEILVNRTNKSSVLVIQQFPVDSDTITLIPKVRESISNVIAFIELGDVGVLEGILKLSDGVFDNILFDADLKCSFSGSLYDTVTSKVKQSKLFHYSDNDAWVHSGVSLILQLEGGLKDKRILICGRGLIFENMLHRLNDFNHSITAYTPQPVLGLGKVRFLSSLDGLDEKFDVIIGASTKEHSMSGSESHAIAPLCNVYDLGIGNFPGELIASMESMNCQVYRLDIRAGISGVVLSVLETDYLIHNMMGKAKLNGVEIVAGGVMGSKGAIIVDQIKDPSYVIGEADGEGNMISLDESRNPNVEFVKRLIRKDGDSNF